MLKTKHVNVTEYMNIFCGFKQKQKRELKQ